MMTSIRIALQVTIAISFVVLGPQDVAKANQSAQMLRAHLHGFEEPPAISTTGRGELELVISIDQMSFEYVLDFSGLEGDVTQGHIHLAQMGVNGGISVWLCGTTSNPGPTGTPSCGGPHQGMATRVVTAADVIGPAGQGVDPGEFGELIEAMLAGVTYANVHSTRNTGGEIRGQIIPVRQGGAN
jgi:hypothetical protein